jgi:hypothetical protein
VNAVPSPSREFNSNALPKELLEIRPSSTEVPSSTERFKNNPGPRESLSDSTRESDVSETTLLVATGGSGWLAQVPDHKRTPVLVCVQVSEQRSTEPGNIAAIYCERMGGPIAETRIAEATGSHTRKIIARKPKPLHPCVFRRRTTTCGVPSRPGETPGRPPPQGVPQVPASPPPPLLGLRTRPISAPRLLSSGLALVP